MPNVKTHAKLQQMAEKVNQQIKIKSRCSYTLLAPTYPNGYGVINASYSPIINHATQNIVGYLNTAHASSLNSIIKLIHSLNYTDNYEDHHHTKQLINIKLTKREKEIMFLYCLKLSCNDIAETLSNLHKKTISHHTVGNILRSKLFEKLHVHSGKALIETVINNNLLNNNTPKEIIPMIYFYA